MRLLAIVRRLKRRTEKARPFDVAAATAEKLDERRLALAKSGHIADGEPIEKGAMGLAFSGGGIRSATISLGVAQALARYRRLLDFDYLSTVSGGGYAGSFLTSLFLPESARGAANREPETPSAAELAEKRVFAEQVLTEAPDVHEMAGRGHRQPIWWLREHSRYLAPNGATDFARAAFYMVRNWVAMLYVFTLPLMLFFLAMTVGGWWALHHLPHVAGDPLHWLAKIHIGGGIIVDDGCACIRDVGKAAPIYVISPVLLLVPLSAFVCLCCGMAYWLTENLKLGLVWRKGKSSSPAVPPQLKVFGLIGTAALGAIGLYLFIAARPFDTNVFTLAFLRFGEAIALGAAAIATVCVFITIWKEWRQARDKRGEPEDAFTISIRSTLTGFGTWWMMCTLILLMLGIVDTLALAIHDHWEEWIAPRKLKSIFSTALIPAAAWLINKISAATSDSDGKWTKALSAYAPALSAVAGVLLFGALAAAADVIIQLAIWRGDLSWPVDRFYGGATYRETIALMAGAVILLAGITGYSTGFINLSSMHSLYASRLTRAYLGATNIERLKSRKPITDTDSGDYIDIARYQHHATAAPLHLINVTLNETLHRGGSTLVVRDRKGVPLVFAPEGIFVDAAHDDASGAGRRQMPSTVHSWQRLREAGVESLNVGQLCAISGAAASPGMGARTSLGTSLALTFANIRLGYWWDVGNLLRVPCRQRRVRRWLARGATLLHTYFYLGNEMLGRYSRDYHRVYLSDGGHFENSGAYELLRRGVKLILVCDNGADPAYRFEDFEQLVRKARIDLGLELRVAPGESVAAIFGDFGAKLFLNRSGDSWRPADGEHPARAFVLLVEVFDEEGNHKGWMFWMKPTVTPDMPEDVVGYAKAHPDFPQQTTGDQFFDEAQWESYRMLGFGMMERLLTGTSAGADCMRAVVG